MVLAFKKKNQNINLQIHPPQPDHIVFNLPGATGDSELLGYSTEEHILV